MKLVCEIKNNSNADYPVIVVRKLYQKIFWEKDLQTFTIYTALVLGAENPHTGKRLNLKENFTVEVNFALYNDDDNFIQTNFKIEDKSNCYIEEQQPWQGVWSEETRLIEHVDDFNNNYKQLFDKEISKGGDIINKYFLLKEKKIDSTIAKIAKIQPIKNGKTVNKYFIHPEANLYDNIEIMTFTSTTFSFPKSTDDFDYLIKFGDNQQFHCYDNSVFFVFPTDYDAIRSDLIIESDVKTSYQNAYSPIRGKVKIKYLQEWIKMGILDRKYYRVVEKEFKRIHNIKSILFSISIENTQNPVLKKFIYGLLVSLFFSYGLDQNRLNIYKKLFYGSDLGVTPDLNFVLTYSLFFLSIMIKLSIGTIKENYFTKFFRITGLILPIIWFVFVYLFSSISYYQTSSATNLLQNNVDFDTQTIMISWILNICSLLTNVISICLLYYYHGKQINFSLKPSFNRLFR